MPALLAVTLALLPPSPSPRPQGPDTVVATYRLGDRTVPITRADLALEMASHLRRRERGREACELLVASTLTRRAATAKGVLPTEPEVRAFWRELQQQLRAAGRDPSEFAAVRNTDEAQWLDDLAMQMAQERLVRLELGLEPREPVSGDMLQLWLQEQRKAHRVVADPDELPPGTAVRVGTTDVPLIDLGLLLLRTAEDDERDRFVRQIAFLGTVESLARQEGIVLTDADLDASVQRRRDEAARDQRYAGVSFESMLKAEGLTVAALRQLRVFRGQLLLERLAARRFPAAELAAELQRDRQTVLERLGPRRRIAIVFVRALAEPNALVTRDFDAARAELAAARARLATETFANVAALVSEHNGSKLQGGDVGWHRRRSDKLPEPVLAAAFALPAGEVSMPVTAEDGCFLVRVAEIEPAPGDDVLLARLRELRTNELSQRLLAEARVEAAARPAEPRK